MCKFKFFLIAVFLSGATTISWAQNEIVSYKMIDTTKLDIAVYYPDAMNASELHPSIIFFFGGGWSSGNVGQFKPHAEYFSKKGIVCFLVDYRVSKRNKSTPFESLADVKSAIRFIRQHATEFAIDTSKIVAAGGSAGGQLAAACAFAKKYNDKADDLRFSSIPNALVLYNPVIDNGPGGYGYERIGEEYKYFSPLHNIGKGAPPTIILIGTEDKLIPVETVKYYKKVMEKVGSRCDLVLYEGESHGFFNYNKKSFENTLEVTEKFLRSLGYLNY